jgi:hypothetical protein
MSKHPISTEIVTYLRNMDRVEGWLDNTTAHVIRKILSFQSSNNITGDVMEIGVHHGRLFILSALLTNYLENCVAVDIFDMQDLNIDNSGLGNLDQFQYHFSSFADGKSLKIEKGDSVALSSYLKEKYAGSVRYISVDGGHTREIACNDLWIAQSVLTKDGVCSLDDIYSIGWSGVTAGIARYFAQGGTLVPFAMSPDKVHLATNAMAGQQYREHLISQFKTSKTTQFFEFDNVLLIPGSTAWEFDNWVREEVSNFNEANLRWVPYQWTARWFSEKQLCNGKFIDGRLNIKGTANAICLWGPYVSLKPGRYIFKAELHGEHSRGISADIVEFSAERMLMEKQFAAGELIEMEFTVDYPVTDLEFRLRCEAEMTFSLENVTLDRI